MGLYLFKINLPTYKLHGSENIPSLLDLKVRVQELCLHECVTQLFQGGQVQSAPQGRQISICGIPIISSPPAPGFAHSYKNYDSIAI